MTESGPVVVCGATGLIGSEIARHLAGHGHTIAVHGGSNAARATSLAAACGGGARAFLADLSRTGEADRLLAEVERDLGAPYAVVDAVALPAGDALVADLDDEAVADHLRNLELHVGVARAAARSLSRGGRIVLLSGALSSRVHPGLAMYSATCAAVNALVRTLALEVGSAGVTVNAIAPGKVRTEEDDLGAEYDALEVLSRQRAALADFATPADIASLAGYLVSAEAAAITGQIVYLAAGEPV